MTPTRTRTRTRDLLTHASFRAPETPANTRPRDGWPEPDTSVVRVEQVEREVKRRERSADNAGLGVFAELGDDDEE